MGRLVIVGFLVAVVGLLALVFGLQRRLLYFPSQRDAAGRGRPPFTAWRTADDRFLGYCREVASPGSVVLFFHGNAGEALDRSWVAGLVPPTAALCLVEYPGYGARPGSPTETDLFAAAEEAFDVARQRWSAPIVVIGESLGTGVASYLASKRPCDRLALISPFSSVGDVAKVHYAFLPVTWLLRDRYDSLAHLRNVKVPLHVIHGEADAIIPPSQGRRLVDEYSGATKTFTALPGIGHNDIAEPLLGAPAAAPFREFLRR